ncbi:phosphate ABC transporter permease [Kovacikia minuta CCNUW1]|uniref:phosphate ABC transporter permease n=1 Tax=Kovacikia minuta TaxID=2931930 RepID=UPI001CC9E58E|nr:phosphate ABC transporter permease [Kovacikia minuta]UBF23879.1 phosphate ABC transporter permease [Kovacikia minuta CCNUW1]
MLIPLTRKTFESLIPRVATGPQYVFYWGKASDFLRRLLISIVGVTIVILGIGLVVGPDIGFFRFLLGISIGLYWLWGPVLWASLRNLEYRKFSYSGFWQGEVLEVYLSEELIGKEETVNERGDLVVVENRERCLNIEVGDESGFSTRLQVPLNRSHQAIRAGDVAEMLVLSNRRDLGRISKTSDIYIPDNDIWVSDYPYLQREAFVEVSQRLHAREQMERERSNRNKPDPAPTDRSNPSAGGALARRPRRRNPSTGW